MGFNSGFKGLTERYNTLYQAWTDTGKEQYIM